MLALSVSEEFKTGHCAQRGSPLSQPGRAGERAGGNKTDLSKTRPGSPIPVWGRPMRQRVKIG